MKIEMEGWWDKEPALLDLHSERKTQKEGNRGDGFNMSGIQSGFGDFGGANKSMNISTSHGGCSSPPLRCV